MRAYASYARLYAASLQVFGVLARLCCLRSGKSGSRRADFHRMHLGAESYLSGTGSGYSDLSVDW